MKRLYVGVVLVLLIVAGILFSCGGEQAASDTEDGGETYTSAFLDTSYPGALSVSDQLALGTMLLEGTENAITPEQAAALLPLWRALQGGGVTVQAEVNAVLKQIEGTMTGGQLQVIAAMQLTGEDLQTWMEKEGIEGRPPLDEDARATLQAGGEGGEPPEGRGGPPGGWEGGEIPPEMATRRAEFENMTDEEREAARATMQAGGGAPGWPGGGRGGTGGGRQSRFLLDPLISLLEERAKGVPSP